MELRWLEAFVAVAEEMHFGRAAKRLHIAQSPLSQIIRKLERDLDTSLFERSTRSVSLTTEGEVLLPYAYRILRDVRNAADAVQSAEGQLTGTLTLGFSGVRNHHTLPVLIRAIRQEYPRIAIDLVSGVRTKDGIKRVEQGELDLSFIGVMDDLGEPLKTHVLAKERVGIVFPSDHPLAKRKSVRIDELRDQAFVTGPLDGSSTMTMKFLRACKEAGFEPNVVQTVDDPFLGMSLVASGLGISLITSEVREVLPPYTVWVEIEGNPVHFLHGVVWSTVNESPALRAVIDVVQRVFAEPKSTDAGELESLASMSSEIDEYLGLREAK